MTVETELSDKTATEDWASKARRQGGHTPGFPDAQAKPEAQDDGIVFAPIPAPPIWPRIFPGI